jgi:hypothetical protein
MEESMNTGLSPEKLKKLQEQQDAEWEADYNARHSEQLVSAVEPSEDEPAIAEFEAMIASFRLAHSLEFLNTISDISPQLAIVFEFNKEISLTPEELDDSLSLIAISEPEYAKNQRRSIATAKAIYLSSRDKVIYDKRTAAKKDLEDIVKELDKLRGSKDYEKLKAECSLLEKAVGSIPRGSNKVNHS